MPLCSRNRKVALPSAAVLMCGTTPSSSASFRNLEISECVRLSIEGPRQHKPLHCVIHIRLASDSLNPGMMWGDIWILTLGSQIMKLVTFWTDVHWVSTYTANGHKSTLKRLLASWAPSHFKLTECSCSGQRCEVHESSEMNDAARSVK